MIDIGGRSVWVPFYTEQRTYLESHELMKLNL